MRLPFDITAFCDPPPSTQRLEAIADVSSWVTIDVGPSKPAFVYVLKDGVEPIYKIGLSNRPLVRMHGLETGGARTLTLQALYATSDRRTARALEKALHQRFIGQLVKGEWFRESEELVVLIATLTANGNGPAQVRERATQAFDDGRAAFRVRQQARARVYEAAGRPARAMDGMIGSLLVDSSGEKPPAGALIGDETGRGLVELLLRRAEQSGQSFRACLDPLLNEFRLGHIGLLKHTDVPAALTFLGAQAPSSDFYEPAAPVAKQGAVYVRLQELAADNLQLWESVRRLEAQVQALKAESALALKTAREAKAAAQEALAIATSAACQKCATVAGKFEARQS